MALTICVESAGAISVSVTNGVAGEELWRCSHAGRLHGPGCVDAVAGQKGLQVPREAYGPTQAEFCVSFST